MTAFTQALNTDTNGKLTSSIYDTNVNQWMQPAQNYAQNASNIWVPVSPTNPIPSSVYSNPLSSVVTMQNAAIATGVGTVLPTSGAGVATLAISGTFVGTIEFDGQGPDGNWYPINGRPRGSSNPPATTATAPGLYSINCRGIQAVRANITAYTSGSITVKGQAQALPASDADEIMNVELLGSIPITLDSSLNIFNSQYTLWTTAGSYLLGTQVAILPTYNKCAVLIQNNTNQTATILPVGGVISSETGDVISIDTNGTPTSMASFTLNTTQHVTLVGLPILPFINLDVSFATLPTSGTFVAQVYRWRE